MVIGFWSRKKQLDPRVRRWLTVLCVIPLLGAVGFALWRIAPRSESFYTDADTIKEPVAVALTRDILWQPPAPLSELINTAVDDYEPRLSADGLTLYFVRGKAGENADIFTSRKTYDGWSSPHAITAINSEADDLGPEPSKDGTALYFYSNRAGTFGGYDLWVARFEGDRWTTPVNLGPNVNSTFNDYGPALTGAADKLFFSSNRPQPTDEDASNPDAWSATLREDLFYRTYDLYSAAINDRGIGAATPIVELNTPFNEGAPAVSPFGDFLYFSSDRPGGEGGFDLYRSRSLLGGYREATNLGPSINTAASELDPALAMGGYALYFSSDRRDKSLPVVGEEVADAAARAEVAPKEYNLFYSTSREVFADTERRDRDPIDWAALWGVIGPNLLWALLALLLLLAMLSLYGAMQDRKMGLLAKCLLASVAAHLLLLMLMNAWEVAAAIAGEFDRRGAIQVAIASPSSGNAIASQIRGELTQFELPDAALAAPLERVATTATPDALVERVTLTVDRSHLRENELMPEQVKVADSSRRPQSESVIPERVVDISMPAALLNPSVPNEHSRIDTDEMPAERQVEAERAVLAVRATVDAPTHRDAAGVRMNPARTPVDLSQVLQVTAAEMANDQREPLPRETAFVESGVPEKAVLLVDAELVTPATPRDRAMEREAAEIQVAAPGAEQPPQQARVDVSLGTIVSAPLSGSTHPLPERTDRAKLAESKLVKVNLLAETTDATAAEAVYVPDTRVAFVNAPLVPLLGDLAAPTGERVEEIQAEEPGRAVQASATESVRAPTSDDFSDTAAASSARVASAVAPSEMPVEHLPAFVVATDAPMADRPMDFVADVVARDNAIPPPLAAATLALPAVDRAEHESLEVAMPKVALDVVVPKRMHTELLASAAVPSPDSLFTETIVPSRVWRDAPIRASEQVPSLEFVQRPPQPFLADSLRLPTAVAVTPELKLETVAEEIEPQLESNDPWKDEVLGVLRGKITDKESGDPLAGAEVRLTLPFVGAIVAVADRIGRYSLDVPAVPEFFAVSATLDGYVPETKSVSRDQVEGRRLRVDFELSPQDRATLVMEAIPDVHHLGDNRFDGRINSQFQKESEGDRYGTTFRLESDQLSQGLREGEVVLLAKGVQRSHRIVINGETLDDRLEDAPSDGSFGEFVASFDVSILREGENTLEVIAKPSSSDIDDFEFVNVRVRLLE